MGTDINIKRRIAVQEESVTVTSDVNSINFTGDGVTASAIGDDVTVNIPGGMGNVTYYLNETVSQAPYKEFSSFPTGAVEQTILTTIGAGATSTIQSFQTPSGIPGTTNIPAGLWSFYLHFSGTGANTFNVYVEVYKRDLGGIETLLLTTDSVSVTPGVTAAMTLTDGVFPASTVLTTDRIVVKIKAQNTEATPSPITFHTEGATNYSVSTTTLNQVVPGGTVTAVTGTAPIASSGGTTPAISISQSGVASDGYLSSTDWNTFNNKADNNIYTANGTLTGNRTVDLNSNTLTFSNGIVNFNQGTTNSGEIRLYEDADFGGNYIALRAPQSFGSDISLFLPASLGTNGQVLTTNGLGVTSWTTVGATGLFGIADLTGTYTYYTTLTLAMAAATSGQTIEQFADITETGVVTINWKDGVNFNGNGHTYIHSYPSGDSNTINLPSTTVTCTIFNWRVIRTNRSNGTATDFAFYVTPGSFDSNNSVVKFTGVYIESTYGNAVNFNAQGGSYNGTLYAKAYLNAITSYNNILDGLYGESTSSGYGLANGGNGTTNCIGKSVSGRGLYGYGNVRNCFGISTSGIGLGQGSNGTGPYYNCVGVSTSSAGGSVGTFYNCTLLSTSGIAGDGVGGSNNTLISSSNYAWFSFFPGYKTTNSFLLSSSNVAAATRGAILKNCVIRSEYNNVAGHAISEWFNDSVSKIISCDLEVTNASANCINSSAGALNIKIANCTYDGATTPVGSNITQSLINTQDNQGNILL